MRRHPPANREDELGLFDRMASGQARQRILLLEARSGIGKTTLLAEFVRRCPADVPCAPLDLKGHPGLHQVLARICDQLDWARFPTFRARVEELARAGSAARAAPHQVQGYNVAAVRLLLRAAFTPDELSRFCHDRAAFRPLLDRFGRRADLEQMIDVLLTFCEKRLLFAQLEAEIRQYNPDQHKRHAARLRAIGGPAVTDGTPPRRTGGVEVEDALRAADEGQRALRREVLTRALFADLRARAERLVLIFDTYEQADPEVQGWLADLLLAHSHRTPNLVVVVAGQQVPQESIEWAACCHYHPLPPLADTDAWDEYSRRNGWNVPRPWIEGYCAATRGDPGRMEALLVGAARWGGGSR